MKIAIVGYREFTDYNFFKKKLKKILKEYKYIPQKIISGGCRGADKLAEKYANDKKIKLKIYNANWDKYGKSAGNKRNKKIVNKCDILIAYLSNESVGTKNTINMARNANKKIHIIKI